MGDEFQLYEVVLTPEKKAQDVRKQIEDTLLEKGFAYFQYDDYTNIIIRFALSSEGFGTEQDLEKKNEIEDILGACLRSTGNGDCDGSEIGNGQMLIFCHVIDQEKAIQTIKEELKEHIFLDGAEITSLE